MIKTRVVRHTARATPFVAHLSYLRREGVTRDGEKARLFGPSAEDGNGRVFAERCTDDRHHFRLIVSPEDAADMAPGPMAAGEAPARTFDSRSAHVRLREYVRSTGSAGASDVYLSIR